MAVPLDRRDMLYRYSRAKEYDLLVVCCCQAFALKTPGNERNGGFINS